MTPGLRRPRRRGQSHSVGGFPKSGVGLGFRIIGFKSFLSFVELASSLGYHRG